MRVCLLHSDFYGRKAYTPRNSMGRDPERSRGSKAGFMLKMPASRSDSRQVLLELDRNVRVLSPIEMSVYRREAVCTEELCVMGRGGKLPDY
jgi:hypothetical protein